MNMSVKNKNLKQKNYALLFVLIFLITMFYAVTMIKLGTL